MSNVSTIDAEGISNAWNTNVMMKRPVTSTPASEARNSTVVSRGFSSGSFSCSFLANRPLSGNYRTTRRVRFQRVICAM